MEGEPYDSTQDISSNVVLLISIAFVLFCLYAGYRVWRSLKDEKQNQK